MSNTINNYLVGIGVLIGCLITPSAFGQCQGILVDRMENLEPEMVKIHLTSMFLGDETIGYEFGPKGFGFGTGQSGIVDFDLGKAHIYAMNLEENVTYELYICGQYTYSFSSIMHLDCFEDDFEEDGGFFGGWKSEDPIPGFGSHYSYVAINSGSFGNESNYLRISSTTPTWFLTNYQKMELVSPEINAIKNGEWVLLEFDIAASGFNNQYGYTPRNPYLPKFEIFLRSKGKLDMSLYTGVEDNTIYDELITNFSFLPYEEFIHYSIWIKPKPGFSSILFKMSESRGSIFLDNIEISTGDHLCWGEELIDEDEDNRRVTLVKDMTEELNENNVKNGQEIELFVSPNPVNNKVNFAFLNECEFVQVRVYTIEGLEVLRSRYENVSNVEMDISELASAQYFFQFETEKGYIVKQLFKR